MVFVLGGAENKTTTFLVLYIHIYSECGRETVRWRSEGRRPDDLRLTAALPPCRLHHNRLNDNFVVVQWLWMQPLGGCGICSTQVIGSSHYVGRPSDLRLTVAGTLPNRLNSGYFGAYGSKVPWISSFFVILYILQAAPAKSTKLTQKSRIRNIYKHLFFVYLLAAPANTLKNRILIDITHFFLT